MKKLILNLLVFFCFQLISTACPVYHIGTLYVVNEQNKPLNAEVWMYHTAADSFKKKASFNNNKDWYFDEDEPTEEEAQKMSWRYIFYSGGFYFDYFGDDDLRKKADKELLIRCEGYADVILTDLDFKRSDKYRPSVLVVVMYAQKTIRTSNGYTTISCLQHPGGLEVKDSMRLEFNDYIDHKTQTESQAEENLAIKIKLFPNPVTDYVILENKLEQHKQVLVKILSADGKELERINVEEEQHKIQMNWFNKGKYLLIVEDQSGHMLHRQWLVKL
jgi:hypothetical protein